MEEVVRLRSGMDGLSDKEFETFLQSMSREYICSLIFNRFNYELQGIQSIQEIDNVISCIQQLNQNINKIITSRERNKTKVEEDEEVTMDQIDKLPLVMISEISSFLEYDSMTNFELCNRTIFVGTRSPISLYSVPKDPFNKYIKFCAENKYKYHWKMHRFRACKEMRLSVESCFTYNSDGGYIYRQYLLRNLTSAHWNNTRTLRLNGGFDHKYDGNEYPYWIRLFRDLATCNASNITHAYVHGPNRRGNDVCPQIFDYISSIEYVALDQSLSSNSISEIEWPSTLKGIQIPFINMFHGDPAPEWRFGDELQSFHGPQGVQQMVHKLQNLREICLRNWKRLFWSMLELLVDTKHGLSHLQRIHYSDLVAATFEDRQRILLKLWRIKTVNYISVNASYNVNKFKRL
eukprot:746470_1